MFLTLDQLVREYLIEIGEQSQHKYQKYLQFGINGLRQFNFDVDGIAKPIVIPVNDNDTVDLPNDYINYIRIGVCGEDGNIHQLAENKEICFPLGVDDCGDIQASKGSSGTVVIDYFEGGHFRNNEAIGRRFGIGGGSSGLGFYRVNEREGFIALQGFTGDNIVMEYMADIERNNAGEFTVHPFIVQALKEWMSWQGNTRNPRIGPAMVESSWRTYKTQRSIAKRRIVSQTIQETKNITRKHFTPAVKA